MRPAHYRKRPRVILTPRQRQVLELVARGKTNPQIAAALGITLDGAKFHVSEILDRLGVATREEAAVWWREQHSVPARVFGVLSLLFTRWVAVGAAGVAAAGIAAIVVVAAGAGTSHRPNSAAAVSPTTTAARDATSSPSPSPTVPARLSAAATATPASSHLAPCVPANLVAAFAVEGETGMSFMSITLFTPAPCQLEGALSVSAVSPTGVAPGSPMTLSVNTAINREVGIPLAVLMPDYCQPPATTVGVSFDGSVLASFTTPPDPGSECSPDDRKLFRLSIGPQQRGPGGATIVEPIPSARSCDLTTAKLVVNIVPNNNAHGGEAVFATLSGFSPPCQGAYKNVGVALVDSSGNALSVRGNPAQANIIVDPPVAGGDLGVNLQWANWCGSKRVAVRLTIDDRPFTAPVSATPSCVDRGGVSELVVEPAI